VNYYDIEVLHGDDVVAAETSVPLDNPRAVWPKVVKIARVFQLPGYRIRVKEPTGGTVILIGAAAARRYPELAAECA
jgi:hypothetical protein